MAVFTAVAAGIGLAINAGQAISSAKRAKKADQAAAASAARVRSLEANRQDIIDPSSQVKDLSSMISNPYANLQVATGAAEFASEQQDLALASTLDTLRATGAGAGGATALAQAATRGRQQIAADIQRQEAQNSRLRAQGEARADALRMQEATRVQSAKVAGQQFVFQAQETREMQALNRAAGQQAQSLATSAGARANMIGAIGSGVGNAMSLGKSLDALGQNPSVTGSQFKDDFTDMANFDVGKIQIKTDN